MKDFYECNEIVARASSYSTRITMHSHRNDNILMFDYCGDGAIFTVFARDRLLVVLKLQGGANRVAQH